MKMANHTKQEVLIGSTRIWERNVACRKPTLSPQTAKLNPKPRILTQARIYPVATMREAVSDMARPRLALLTWRAQDARASLV
jgi:hypothetical protein